VTTQHHLDARGLICPLPVLKARKILLGLPPGAVLTVSVTDAYAPKDFELFCAESGHVLKSISTRDGATEIIVERSASK
jgi:tRNA 2-thiouridine synthesizing protein A